MNYFPLTVSDYRCKEELRFTLRPLQNTFKLERDVLFAAQYSSNSIVATNDSNKNNSNTISVLEQLYLATNYCGSNSHKKNHFSVAVFPLIN